MVENKKPTVNDFNDFHEKLINASKDKAQLVRLAHDVICASISHRTFAERIACKDVIVNPSTLKINALYGEIKKHSPDFSTKDKLHMIMNSYVEFATAMNPKLDKKKALDNFCKEFAATYPQEYGIRPQQHKADENTVQSNVVSNKTQQPINQVLLKARDSSVYPN